MMTGAGIWGCTPHSYWRVAAADQVVNWRSEVCTAGSHVVWREQLMVIGQHSP